MATVYQDFVPVSIAREVIQSLGERRSAVMQLARTVPMPAGLESVPTVSVAPVASFVNPAYGGRKPIGTIEWTADQIVPEELAVTLAIPNAFLMDSGFPVWESVRDEIVRAFARAFDAAALYGTGAPASFPAGGLTAPAFATALAGVADPVAAIEGAFGAVEATGQDVDGILGGPGLRGVMRRAYAALSGPADAPPSMFYGVDFATTPAWVPGATPYDLALVGAWDNVVIGIREDIRFDLSEDGVLSDAAGVVVVNAFQQDSTLMRAYMRVGMAVGMPLGADGSGFEKPLALAQTTTLFGASGAAAAPAAGSSSGGSLPRTHAELDELAASRGIELEDGATVAEKRAALEAAGVTGDE